MHFLIRYTDEHLVVELLDMEIDAFMRSSTWKVRLSGLKSHGPEPRGNALVFPRSLTPVDCQGIMERLTKLEERGAQITVDDSYEMRMGKEISLLKERATTGAAIKAQDPSVIDRFNEFSRIVNEHMVRLLRNKQMWDAFFMSTMGSSANFSVPGSGKTASVLGCYAFLKERGFVDRIVVVAPKNAFDSWQDEWVACFGDLEPCKRLCFDDETWTGVSTNARKRELGLGYGKYNLITINYEALSLTDAACHAAGDRSLLVFDEVHKVKQVNGKRANAALKIAEHAPYTIALTGTPIPNSYLDLYNLLHILYPRDYDWYFGFAQNMLKKPDPFAVARINQAIQPFFCRTNKHMLGVPEPLPDHLVQVTASVEEYDMLHILRAKLHRDPLALIIRILQLESDPEMLLDMIPETDLEWLSDGADCDAPLKKLDLEAPFSSAALPSNPGNVPTVKTRECVRLVQNLVLEDKKVIVWCIFKRSMDNLVSLLGSLGIRANKISGDVPYIERTRILDGFKHGDIQVLVTNPHTLAESISLHQACHDAIYFECSYNLVHLLQSKDRINRLGLADDQYTQYHFLQTVFPGSAKDGWSLDRNIYTRLTEKEDAMLEAIDRGTLELGTTDEHDLELIFGNLFDEKCLGGCSVNHPSNSHA